MTEYRSELKFVCTQGELEILRVRLNAVMRRDAHQTGESYRVRSLYFDDADESAFYENDAGADDREKFRLRVYDRISDGIRLEIKSKLRGGAKKESCPMERALCETILRGGAFSIRPDDPAPLRTLFLRMQTQSLRPQTIVEYVRCAYVCPTGNVRVTFDCNIAFCRATGAFLSKRLPLTPVLPKGLQVLEVKYDELIPDYILQILETGGLIRTAFSKYYLARMAEKGEYLW